MDSSSPTTGTTDNQKRGEANGYAASSLVLLGYSAHFGSAFCMQFDQSVFAQNSLLARKCQ